MGYVIHYMPVHADGAMGAYVRCPLTAEVSVSLEWSSVSFFYKWSAVGGFKLGGGVKAELQLKVFGVERRKTKC